MKRLHARGFTLIEVTFFLAISGFLLLIVVFGMGPQMKQSEFTDSMQGIASYINQQYNDIQTGVNNRSIAVTCNKSGNSISVSAISGTGQAGNSENCVLLGRQYQFSADGISANDVVGLANPTGVTQCTAGSTDPLVKKLQTSCATKVTASSLNTAQSLSFSWGNQLQNGAKGRIANATPAIFNADADYTQTDGFGIYRDPDSGQIFTVLYDGATALPTSNINAQFCFKGQVAYYGAIYFGGSYNNGGDSVSGGNNLVNVKVDDSSCTTWKDGSPAS